MSRGNKRHMGRSAGLLVSVIVGMLFALFARDWLVQAFLLDPLAFIAWSAFVALVSALASAMFYGDAQKDKALDAEARLEEALDRLADAEGEINALGGIRASAGTREEEEHRQHVLDMLSMYGGNPTRIASYVDDQMKGPMEERTRFAEAVADLRRCGCIEGFSVADVPGGDYLPLGLDCLRVLKKDYPGVAERSRIMRRDEIKNAVMAMAGDSGFVDRIEKELDWRQQRRMR